MHVGSRFASIIAGRRTAWAFALVPIVFALAAIGVVGEAAHETDPRDLLPDGADSTAAAWLTDDLPDEATEAAIVLWTADEGELDESALAEIERQATGALVPAEDGTAVFTVVPVTAGDADEVGAQVDDLREQLRADVPDGVTVQVTGPAGIRADLGKVFDGADLRLLLSTMLIVAVLLVVTYRSPVLWVIPLVVVGLADRVAVVAATQTLDAVGLPWDGTTTGILSVLVFGAGTDYALLLISRYRDELRATAARHEAMAHALRRTSEAVLGSATTVFLAVLTLLLSLTPSTRGLGLACAVGVVVAAAFALVVLPATLVLVGRWAFWPMVPRHGDQAAVDKNSVFHRVGGVVSRRPALVVTGTLVLLAVLASGLAGVRLGLDQSDQLLDRPESVTAAERLAESYPPGTVEPTQVITRGPQEQVLSSVEETEGVGSARVTGSGGGLAQIEVVLTAEPGSDEAHATIDRLRDTLAEVPDTHVGGNEAEAMDERSAAERDLLLIVPLILVMVLVGLVVLLRSLLGPVLLVLSVVATFVAALGASWWIFTEVMGFAAVDVKIPLFAFLFLVALGVDYNIFLVTRAREEAARYGSREGMLRALTVTGGVITSAGILLAAVFAVLGVLPLVALAQLGTIICVGVLLDTLVVRTMLVPAVAVLLGDRFWWPRRVG
ncbi:MMPL family transporter [Nocardioides sp. MAH-18]|uniref:MMPL family transporter n=1 Tax=Nocardioides agri TaxID=2682843 RepID=A0A6L6XWS5_9ACTN|nr:MULTISPECIES: MMPL family transporter [unclassified Nocardioides]MBA2955122.1 MMPL family transporter [Nocardioides sp. CGMCC 1.13656]MVQ49975.1 MMPL family transporter [Nocardioides sp. MAH-18]